MSTHQSPLLAGCQVIDLACLGSIELTGNRIAIIENFSSLSRLRRAAKMATHSFRWLRVQRELHRRHGLTVSSRAVAIPDLESPTFFVELDSQALRYYTNRLCQQNDHWPVRTIKKCLQCISRIPMEAGAVIIFAEKDGCN